jgi:hypothetical protein
LLSIAFEPVFKLVNNKKQHQSRDCEALCSVRRFLDVGDRNHIPDLNWGPQEGDLEVEG